MVVTEPYAPGPVGTSFRCHPKRRISQLPKPSQARWPTNWVTGRGAEHRLNRKFGTWGTEAYAAEELRAEICSACLCAELGIATPMDNHAAYVGSWLKLREDKFEIFRAAKDARKMVDFLTGRMGLGPAAPTQPTQTREAARPRLAVAMEAPVSATTLAVGVEPGPPAAPAYRAKVWCPYPPCWPKQVGRMRRPVSRREEAQKGPQWSCPVGPLIAHR